MVKKIFVLEDNELRIKYFEEWFYQQFETDYEVFYARDVSEAKKLFEENKPFDIYFLDHDLGGEVMVKSEHENTGYQFARFLSENDVRGYHENIYVHSLNPVGAQNIVNVLPRAKRVTLFNF